MSDPNIMALLLAAFAVHCITMYASIKLLITGKPLWGARVEPVLDMEKFESKLEEMTKEALVKDE